MRSDGITAVLRLSLCRGALPMPIVVTKHNREAAGGPTRSTLPLPVAPHRRKKRSPIVTGNRTRCSSAPPTARVLANTGNMWRSGALVACAPVIPATRAVLHDDARSDNVPTRDHRRPLTPQYTVFARPLMSPGVSFTSDFHCCYGCQRVPLDGCTASRAAFRHCVPSTRPQSGFDRGHPVTGRLATAGESFAK
jgi:hypothetical protein